MSGQGLRKGTAVEGDERRPREGVIWMSFGVPSVVLIVVVVDVEGRNLHGKKSEKET